MSLKLYPVKTIRLTNKTAEQDIPTLWQSVSLSENEIVYGIYNNYESDHNGEYDFTIAVEKEVSGVTPMEINDDFYWFESFTTNRELLADTWKTIWNKSKQGLLKRTYSLDFEKHYPDGKVEINISIQPHC
ncbi:effector binding domain-containing protein [Otariodibacter sp.]|uniref:GyrI-like domain-containing protein n=1 Tax=Otariodibacter sp. TaxID=3030919 RepID=UPI002630A41E|nr:effector binding domain-containing protein [Otariodibacter sp.]